MNNIFLSKIESIIKRKKYFYLFSKYNKYTMIKFDLFKQNLNLIESHFNTNVLEGAIVECGVWRGGMIACIAEILGKEYEYHLFDSFEGLPPAEDIDGKAAINWQQNKESNIYFENCKADISYAISAMGLAGIKPIIHPGWFNETTKVSNIKTISLLRLDGDWYESTLSCLINLYPLVEENGVIIIDDYFAWDGCSKAVHNYLASIKSNSKLRTVNEFTYIIKTENGRNII